MTAFLLLSLSVVRALDLRNLVVYIVVGRCVSTAFRLSSLSLGACVRFMKIGFVRWGWPSGRELLSAIRTPVWHRILRHLIVAVRKSKIVVIVASAVFLVLIIAWPRNCGND